MARLPTLVDAISQHDGRDKATIAHVSRRLRDSHHIVSSKRGVGGAVMTMKDAATLLMGAYGDIGPHAAPDAVDRMKTLQPLPATEFDEAKREELPDELAFLGKRMSFAETIEQLLIHAPALDLWSQRHKGAWAVPEELKGLQAAEWSMLQGAWKFRRAGVPNLPATSRPIRVVCYAPGFAAEIHIGLQWAQLDGADSPFHGYYLAPSAARADVPSLGAAGSITLEFGLPTILALHRAVIVD